MTEAETKSAHTARTTRLRSKDAKLTLKLKADSGYSCDMDARVSAEQWGTINRIVEGDGLAEAAAPDLLAALRKATTQIGIWRTTNGDMVGALAELENECRAAITRAEGA